MWGTMLSSEFLNNLELIVVCFTLRGKEENFDIFAEAVKIKI